MPAFKVELTQSVHRSIDRSLSMIMYFGFHAPAAATSRLASPWPPAAGCTTRPFACLLACLLSLFLGGAAAFAPAVTVSASQPVGHSRERERERESRLLFGWMAESLPSFLPACLLRSPSPVWQAKRGGGRVPLPASLPAAASMQQQQQQQPAFLDISLGPLLLSQQLTPTAAAAESFQCRRPPLALSRSLSTWMDGLDEAPPSDGDTLTYLQPTIRIHCPKPAALTKKPD